MEQPIKKYQRFGGKTFYVFISRNMKIIVMALVFGGLAIYGLTFLPENLSEIKSIINYGVIGLGTIITVGTVLISWLEYSHYRIEIYNDFLKITRGIIVLDEVGIPYKRIVEIKIHRSLSEQMIGLANIRITVFREDDPRTRENESLIILPALTKAIASEIQHDILERTNISEIATQEPLPGANKRI